MSELIDKLGLPLVIGNAIKSIAGNAGVVVMGEDHSISSSEATANIDLAGLTIYYMNSMSYFLFNRFAYPASIEIVDPEKGEFKVVKDDSKQLYSGADSNSFKLLLGMDALIQLSSVLDETIDLSTAFVGFNNLISMHDAGDVLDEVQFSPLLIGSELAQFGLKFEDGLVEIMQDNPELLSLAMSDVKFASEKSIKGLSHG